MPEILDEETIEILSSMDSFFIQQRVTLIEAITQGCWEQPNVYDVFDHETNKRVMVSCLRIRKACRNLEKPVVSVSSAKKLFSPFAVSFQYLNRLSKRNLILCPDAVASLPILSTPSFTTSAKMPPNSSQGKKSIGPTIPPRVAPHS